MSSLSKELRQAYNVRSRPIARTMRFRLFKDITKGSKLTELSRFSGRTMPATLNECRGAGEQYGFHACAHPSTRVIKTKAGQRPHKDPERKAKSRQVGKEKGEYKEQLRRCRSEVILHTAFIRNLKWKTKTLGGPELRPWAPCSTAPCSRCCGRCWRPGSDHVLSLTLSQWPQHIFTVREVRGLQTDRGAAFTIYARHRLGLVSL